MEIKKVTEHQARQYVVNHFSLPGYDPYIRSVEITKITESASGRELLVNFTYTGLDGDRSGLVTVWINDRGNVYGVPEL